MRSAFSWWTPQFSSRIHFDQVQVALRHKQARSLPSVSAANLTCSSWAFPAILTRRTICASIAKKQLRQAFEASRIFRPQRRAVAWHDSLAFEFRGAHQLAFQRFRLSSLAGVRSQHQWLGQIAIRRQPERQMSFPSRLAPLLRLGKPCAMYYEHPMPVPWLHGTGRTLRWFQASEKANRMS